MKVLSFEKVGKLLTSPNVVLSILPLTTLAASISVSLSKGAEMMGVLIFFEALMISLILGTPSVISMAASKQNN